MRWMDYISVWALAFLLLLFLFSPFSVGAEEITADQLTELNEIFNELEIVAMRQAETIEILQSKLKTQDDIMNRLNSSLIEATISLRRSENRGQIDLWVNRAGFLLGGIIIGGVFVKISQ